MLIEMLFWGEVSQSWGSAQQEHFCIHGKGILRFYYFLKEVQWHIQLFQMLKLENEAFPGYC